jgi:hypothetical protein
MAAVDPTDGKALIAALELLNKQAEEKENERYRASLQRVVDAIGRKLGCGEGDIGAVERAPWDAANKHGLHGGRFVARWRLPSGHVLGYGLPNVGPVAFGPYVSGPSDEFALMPPGTPLNGHVDFNRSFLLSAQSEGDMRRAYALQQLITPAHLEALFVLRAKGCICGDADETGDEPGPESNVEYYWDRKPDYSRAVKMKVVTEEVYFYER